MKFCSQLVLLPLMTAVAWSADLPKVRLLTDWFPEPEHGGYYNALVKGYYKEAGLDVEVVAGGTQSDPRRRVALGEGEFGLGGTDEILLCREKGLAITAIGIGLQHDPQAMMVHDESPIHSLAEIEGHDVAIAPGAIFWRYLRKKYAYKSVREQAYTFSIAPFLHNPALAQQAFITSEPFFARKQGVKVRLLPTRDSGYDLSRVYFVSDKFLSKNPALVKAFVGATLRGWKDYLEHPEAAHAEIKRRNPEMNEEWMTYTWKTLKEEGFLAGDPAKGEKIGQLQPARWEAIYKILRDLDVIKTDYDWHAAYTLQFQEP